MLSLPRLARGGVGLEPRVCYKNASRNMRVHCFINRRRGYYTSHLSHIISVLVIPNEFPTLLAKREIIANA